MIFLALMSMSAAFVPFGCKVKASVHTGGGGEPNDEPGAGAGGTGTEAGTGGTPAMGGTDSAGAGGAEGGTSADAGGTSAGGTSAGAGGAEGGAGGTPIVQIDVPEEITDGDVRVSCTVTCKEDTECLQGSVFVSACAADTPGLCYEVTPIDDPSGDGNTYIVSIDDDGESDVIESATCTSAEDSTEGLPADLLFVIDTSSSMAAAISGVIGSIDSFVDELASQGVNMRIGGIAFADTSPLLNCVAPDAGFAPFTDKFGLGTEEDPESFTYWLNNVSTTHCGDYGGSDIPENALDALGFALGHDANSNDTISADAFEWAPNSLKVIVLITDAPQHDQGQGSTKAHFSFADIKSELQGFAVVHVVGPNYGCYNTPAASCACNVTRSVCDTGCECDLRCLKSDCPEDTTIGVCNVSPLEGATCDPDCRGYPSGSSCDITVNRCDFATDSTTEACADDFDCTGSMPPGTTVNTRRCEPTPQTPYVDIGELTTVTNGAFSTLPSTGVVDLTKLPLTGVLVQTEQCDVPLPEDATAVRCVYSDADGHKGEVVVDLK
jgi:hypothetical protein